MYGLVRVSFASLAFFSSSILALPYQPSNYAIYGHDDPARSQSITLSSQLADPTTAFPTLTLDLEQKAYLAAGYTNPSGYLTGSGFLPFPTASGYAWPSGTGYAYPTGTGYGYAHPTGYSNHTGWNSTISSKWLSWSSRYGHPTASAESPSAYPVPTQNATSAYSISTEDATSSYPIPTKNATSTYSQDASSTSTFTHSTPTGSSVLPSTLRGVNIGGWLVLEKWMTSSVFDNTDSVDQYTFDSCDDAESKLHAHWASYFTESDVAKLASWGINAVRIPIGFWAYDNSDTPYVTGADAYLEKAIGWCRSHGIQVLVDCHGSPGSQNGFDNSGRATTDVAWQRGNNMQKSISILETIAKKYGAAEYADVVFGIQMVNEPISWGANDFATTKRWAKDAYNAIKAVATNPSLNVIMHDGFMGASEWQEISNAINGDASLAESKFWIDTHLYQNQVGSDSSLDQEQHVDKACDWKSTQLLPASSNLPVIVGEFSAATNICANPDGSTVAGSVCYVDGCQCSINVPIEYWNEPLIQATRKFLEAELDTFERHARGWFMWSYKGPGAWGYANAVEYGIIGQSVTDRMFPGQCDSSS